MATSVYVGDVHGAVGADQAMASFRDQDAALAPHDAMALLCGELYYPRIEMIVVRPAAGREGGFDLGEVYELSLGLGNDFVFDDKNVALAQFLMLESVEK